MHADSETDACRDDQRTGHVFPVRTADAQQQLCHLDTSNITLVLQGTGTHIPSWDFPGKKRGRGVKEPDLAPFQIKMWSRRASSVGIWQDFWHIPSASLVWLHFSVCSFTHWLKVSFFHPKFLFWNFYRKNTFCPGASENTSLIAPCVLLGQLFTIYLPWNTSKKILSVHSDTHMMMYPVLPHNPISLPTTFAGLVFQVFALQWLLSSSTALHKVDAEVEVDRAWNFIVHPQPTAMSSSLCL